MDSIDPKMLGQRIQQLRKNKNMSQGELGEFLERSHVAVSYIEQGKTNLTVQDLHKIAAYLGVSVNDLLEQPTPSKATVHFRDAKDTTAGELKELEQATKDFIERVKRIRMDEIRKRAKEN